jgi:hypothetical protein
MNFQRAATVVGLSEDRAWNGIASIELTPGGRLYCVSYTGGPKEPHPDNRVILCWSDDGGDSWTVPMTLGERSGTEACLDPCIWQDPLGRLWVQYTVCDHDMTRPLSVRFSARCDLPDAAEPVFEDLGVFCPECGYVFLLNRPTLLADGRIVLPLVFLQDPSEPGQWYFRRPQTLGCAFSDDGGESWAISARTEPPSSWGNENMIVQLGDGRLWMLARSREGRLWQCFSEDRGETWGEVTLSEIANPSSRFFIGRLQSGRLLLLNNPETGRETMTASLSDDDGRTWSEGVELMAGRAIAYPDAVQDGSGLIHCVVDVDRRRVEYRAFTEGAAGL